MEKKWVIKPRGEKEQIEALAKQLNIHPILVNLLVQRGHSTYEKAKEFFRPELKMLHDPYLMKDMEKAIARIDKAIAGKEKIMVFGDYDVDGTTAVALVYTFLKKRYPLVDFYIPDRYKEGYGISNRGIEWADEQGISLIIALDCGIKSIDKIEYAKSFGIDFIICDHHRPGAELPDAVAVLDPKRNDCDYPFKELSGCGVGFKLIQAYVMAHKLEFSELEEYLDLVAISIAADIVPIVGENRILTYYGLKRLNSKPRPGIKAILDISGNSRELTVNDVVFTIAPRINAAGRIESGNQAVELLISEKPDEAMSHGEEINKKNTTRKNLNETITREAMTLIEQDTKFKDRKSTVLYNPKWHKGVIGIVASKLTDEFYRPTIILTKSNGVAAGSARSVKDFDIYNAIESCSDLLDQFGGHMYAAGLTMKEENIEAFKDRFEEIVCATIEDRMLIREIEIDDVISLGDINASFFNILKQFAPFGPGNMSPVFMSQEVYDRGDVRVVGNNHLKLSLIQKDQSRKVVDSIAFQLGKHFDRICGNESFHVCYHIEENTFNGRTNLQLNVKDIAFD
ncbi:MAG: single-stranded-DNA-specific exonuclease RecJ [Bacteroidia bacterium]|jgi:single-stranded-DNA-specific exonuclease|nr:single-stranded-DNA-specific exonuclease RecJ [Bacteroidia bacterium]